MDSMPRKILITGSAGFVGKYLYQLLKTDFSVFGIDRKESDFTDKIVDISDTGELDNALNILKPEIIIHSAAYSYVDGCEMNKDLAYKINILPLNIIVNWSKLNNARLLFLSSDYVYDGIKGKFTEKDKENPLQYYGQTKLDGEKIIISNLKNYIILRPTVIYGRDPEGMNFFMQLYHSHVGGKKMIIPIDQISNPTFILDLCDLIKKISKKPESEGVYIATGKESIGRYDFALKIFQYMGWEKELLIPEKTEKISQAAKRPLNNSTDSSKVCRDFDFQFKNIDYNLGLIKDQMRNI